MLKKILVDTINDKKSGLMPLGLPTGFGKTYNSIKAIKDCLNHYKKFPEEGFYS